MRLLKTAIGAALFSKSLRSIFLAAAAGLAGLILRLLKTPKGGLAGQATLAALAALLLSMMRTRTDTGWHQKRNDEVIDIDEYTIIEDK